MRICSLYMFPYITKWDMTEGRNKKWKSFKSFWSYFNVNNNNSYNLKILGQMLNVTWFSYFYTCSNYRPHEGFWTNV